MSWSLTPDLYYSSLYAVDMDELARRGLDAIVIDLDNTIVPRDTCLLDDRGREWAARTKDRFKLAIVSNNSQAYPTSMADELDVLLVAPAMKPLRRGFRRAMELLGADASQTAIIGDQIFTDVLGGNRTGITTVLVDPLVPQDLPHTLVLRRFEALIMRGRHPLA
jgi:uncharacterized protein